MRKECAMLLLNSMIEDPSIRVITADLGFGILDQIRTALPARVYNVGAATISQGKMGFIPAALASSVANYSVTGSNAASQSGSRAVVGVAHNGDIATTKYGWLATRGVVYGAPDATETSLNSGVELVPGVDGGFVAYAGTSATGVTDVGAIYTKSLSKFSSPTDL
jgi:hypothetical protein